MLEKLAEAVEKLDISVGAAELRRLLSVRDRLEAKIATAVAEFDAAGLWELDAATSMTAWLKSEARMTSLDASRVANTAKRLRDLPVTLANWRNGELSGGQVATVLASVRPEHRELFVEHESDVIPALAQLNVPDTRRVMAHWSANAEALVEEPEPAEPQRSLYASKALDDRLLLEADLDADSGEVVLAALRVAETTDSSAEKPRAASARRADALVDVCRYFLDNQTERPGGRHRPHVNVVVEAENLYEAKRARYIGGTALEAATIARILCDATFHRCVVDPDGAILDYGRATRTVPAPLWSALVVRDEAAAFPVATGPPSGPRRTTSSGSAGTAQPAWTTSCCSVHATTTSCTRVVGRRS